ncbi:MAG: hypothetical protein PVJ72_15280, partial [Gammaproteobacteria bacterium]
MGPSIPVLAQTLVDIRTTQAIRSDAGTISYRAAIGDCTDLTSVQISAGGTQETLEPSQASRVSSSPIACEFAFNGVGDGSLNPQVTLNFRDASTQVYAESFQVENNDPSLTFDSVSLAEVAGTQQLIIQVTASDDTDLQYVSIAATGLRASDLRSAGGVVDKARQTAFASSQGNIRTYPKTDDQTQFSLSIPVTQALDANAIAHDGVVLLDVSAVDASGNQVNFSKIAFTGSDVNETALGLQVAPTKLIFTNSLETATIVPYVDFQFRGLTPLPGLGNGVSYVSSHPDLVDVTPGGLVYPLQETGANSVTITVTYPGVGPVDIPVEVNFSKVLTQLQVAGLNANGQLELERLNSWFDLPAVTGLFDDGSTAEIGTQLQFEYILGTGASGILQVDTDGRLLA